MSKRRYSGVVSGCSSEDEERPKTCMSAGKMVKPGKVSTFKVFFDEIEQPISIVTLSIEIQKQV